MAVFLNAPLVIELSKEAVPFFSSLQWKINLVMKIAENKEVSIPITRVVAKPLIGPEPNI